MKLGGLKRKKIEISNIPARIEERYEDIIAIEKWEKPKKKKEVADEKEAVKEETPETPTEEVPTEEPQKVVEEVSEEPAPKVATDETPAEAPEEIKEEK